MKIILSENAEQMAKIAADAAKNKIDAAQRDHGFARIMLSTGASQLPFFKEFVKQEIDWKKVEVFHLDEYIGINENHPASFKKYIKQRFVDIVHPVKYWLIDGKNDPQKEMDRISAELLKAPIDLGLIGIGENAHIAFNDPPCDFDDDHCYKIVNLNDTCKQQQVREGWFENEDAVCKQAMSLTCKQIMKCNTIFSIVPYKVKANAVKQTLINDLTNEVPATLLKSHRDFTLFLDEESASLTDRSLLQKYM